MVGAIEYLARRCYVLRSLARNERKTAVMSTTSRRRTAEPNKQIEEEEVLGFAASRRTGQDRETRSRKATAIRLSCAAARPSLHLGLADQILLDDHRISQAFARATAEGYRQGADAPTKYGIVLSGPWGFDPETVSHGKTFLWQGEQDRVMPPAAVHLFSRALPHCSATFYPNQWHLSTFATNKRIGMATSGTRL